MSCEYIDRKRIECLKRGDLEGYRLLLGEIESDLYIDIGLDRIEDYEDDN